jgi:hypothetical protein
MGSEAVTEGRVSDLRPCTLNKPSFPSRSHSVRLLLQRQSLADDRGLNAPFDRVLNLLKLDIISQIPA